MLSVLENPAIEPSFSVLTGSAQPMEKQGNHLLFHCDVDGEGRLSCRWIQGCLL